MMIKLDTTRPIVLHKMPNAGWVVTHSSRDRGALEDPVAAYSCAQEMLTDLRDALIEPEWSGCK
jgi:hypothetical protein